MAPTTLSEKRRAGLSTPMLARHSALRRLIENHQDEFDQLLGDARVEAGLPRDPNEARAEAQAERQQRKREKQMTKLQKRLDQLQAKNQAEMEKLQQQMLELQDGTQ